MGKILDTITVLFKGDTEDLKRKKKEAEDLAAQTAKNIKEIETSSSATNANLENTNKALTEADNLTSNIGAGISAWIAAAHQASTSINEALSAEKAHREQVRVEKSLDVTRRGALEVEKVLIRIVKQFAAATLGAISVGNAVSLFKDVISGTLDLQRTAFSLNLKPEDLDAYGRAAQSAGSGVEEYAAALESLSAAFGGLTGAPIKKLLDTQLELIRKAPNNVAAELYGRKFLVPLPSGLIRAAREGLLTPDKLANYKKIDSGVAEATEKVKELNEAWSLFKTNVRSTFIELENNILGPLTKFVNVLNLLYPAISNPQKAIDAFKQNPLKALQTGYEASEAFKSSKPTNFPLTQGNAAVSNSTTVKIENINVKAPDSTDPGFFGTSVANELQKHISQFLQFNNGPIVG